MAGRWFRVYDELLDDPKVQRLPADAFKALVNLWCLASQNGGILPPVEDIAFKLRLKEEKVEALLSSLTDVGLLDQTETGMEPHNWHSRQFKSDVSTGRVQSFRKRKRNVSSAVSETPPDTETETDIPKADALGADPKIEQLPEAQLFERGKAILGVSSGGLIRRLLAAKGGNIPLARAAIEQASTKQNPREYIGRIVSGAAPPDPASAVMKVAL